jgi:hypothetical protein
VCKQFFIFETFGFCPLAKHYASKTTEDQIFIRINNELASGFMPEERFERRR